MARRLFRTTGFEPCRSEMVLTERGAEELHRHRDKERSALRKEALYKILGAFTEGAALGVVLICASRPGRTLVLQRDRAKMCSKQHPNAYTGQTENRHLIS